MRPDGDPAANGEAAHTAATSGPGAGPRGRRVAVERAAAGGEAGWHHGESPSLEGRAFLHPGGPRGEAPPSRAGGATEAVRRDRDEGVLDMQKAVAGEGGQGERLRVADLATAALLLAVGYVLNTVMPPFYAGMKPDLVLAMLFVILLLFRNLTVDVAAGLAAGVITALTTSMPGGQIPNLVDKIVTTLVVVGVIRLVGRLQPNLLSVVVAVVGTLVSGTVFLRVAMAMGAVPSAAFRTLFLTVVLPTTLANAVVVALLYAAARLARRAMGGATTPARG